MMPYIARIRKNYLYYFIPPRCGTRTSRNRSSSFGDQGKSLASASVEGTMHRKKGPHKNAQTSKVVNIGKAFIPVVYSSGSTML